MAVLLSLICGKCRRKMVYMKELSIPKIHFGVYLCIPCERLEIVKPMKQSDMTLLPGGVVRLRVKLKREGFSLPPFT